LLRPLALALVVALAVVGCSDPAPERRRNRRDPPRYGPPQIVGRIQPSGLVEISGIAASAQEPKRFWAHNDSGGEPVLFCLTLTGASCGTTAVEGAELVDWEDISVVPGSDGDSLYIADIGDNERVREFVTIYRVEGAHPGEDSVVAEAFDVRYPDRPHDAEALVVDPGSGDIYIITKEYTRRASVYVGRAPLRSTTTLELVSKLDLAGPLAVVTGADVSRNGDRVILSTYADGFELSAPEGAPFEEIWDQRPVRVDLGRHKQNEAVTYTRSGDILSASEGALSPLYSVEYLARP
jgi:hypothetical protein